MGEAPRSTATLVVVPCGKAKIWDKHPDAGPTIAREVYVGAPFKVNRGYAERFGDRWVILSAKYGFLAPDETIDGPYNVTFKDRRTEPVSTATLYRQVIEAHLNDFHMVLALGGKDYQSVIEGAFEPKRVIFPFAGLQLGYALGAAKRAIADGAAVSGS